MVFVDDGGVLSDNELRSTEWRRLIGEFLSPRLGGTPEAWGEANRVAFAAQWERWERVLAREHAAPTSVYADFFTSRPERERWLRDMCELVGVATPAGDACLALSIDTEEYVISRLQAAYPEAAAAIQALYTAGHILSTASGHPSDDIARSLQGMGVRDCFTGRLYGPDLVSAHKAGPEYYRRIFADAGVDPGQALVVDDAPRAISWAAEAGARTVHVRRGDAPEAPDAGHTVRDLLELVDLLGS